MFTTRPELRGTFGMVGSTHWLASQAGMAVLEEGGNAFDAAVAAGFVLQVVEPHLNGPGGDATLILRPAGGEPVVLCGQGPAPAAADVDRYRAEGLEVVPGTGLLAAAIPGATPAWLTLLRDHGTLEPARVLRFALGYAEDGHPVLDQVVRTVRGMERTFRDHWPTSAAHWLPVLDAVGRHGGTGTIVRYPALAATYRRLLDAAVGPTREARCEAMLTAWSEGFVAEEIEAFVRTAVVDASGSPHAGVLTGADLAGFRPGYEPPANADWRGHTIVKAGLWSQGPSFLQTLGLLDPLLPDGPELLDAFAHDGALVHTVLEALQLALADRDAWYGDADLTPGTDEAAARLAALLDPARTDERRRLIGAEASTDLRPGSLGGHEPRMAAAVRRSEERTDDPTTADTRTPQSSRETARPGPARGDTCHLDVVDRWGNVLTATPSGGWLQSSPTIPALGFCLGTRLQMTWLEPGLPSTLLPGRRPRTTLSPSLALHPDGTVTAFGTPGGDQQDQWPLVFWLTHALGGLDLQAAIDHPSFNTTAMVSSFDPRTWLPAGVEIEGRFPAAVIDDLAARGHRVRRAPDWSLGRISALSHDPSTGLLRAAANPRGMQGYAVGR
ncbi:gamma-glutamyltranspeptidase/glutathione hydrolase [Friedmanniella endophytica]|uniref:Gamma-glutamyltranspeptidase/glutathione hydrolase n=1 Tax=Microlunatus kandeliicorticis TaxID=1759536 RepID=A0A7W3IUZ9_9ACTN|nr:gamma-glutamyltransferase [Microlunatus kandeliicorticis]MBA8795773.1 gamma-glutamyltranspeptidase/glutathione hydrolase [Microlunatus kandeliicorticis]